LQTLTPEINLVLPFITGDLVSPPARQRLLELGEAIPGNWVAQFGFESWLGANEPRLDFLFKAGPSVPQRQSLAAGKPGFGPAHAGQWELISNFCRLWSSPGSALFENVHDIWVEFDLPGVGHATPGFFFGPRERTPGAAETGGDQWILDEALPVLFGGELPAEPGRGLRRCFAAAPPGARLFHVGLLPGRETRFVRLCFKDLTPAGIGQFLRDVAWPGGGGFDQILAEWAPLANDCVLDIDVWDDVLPKIGIEFYVWDRLAAHRHKWPVFLAHLARTGLATAEQAQALLSWRGYCRQGNYPGTWPERLARAADVLGSYHESVYERTLHHVKISFAPGLPSRAKAYLSAKHLWVNSRSVDHAPV